MPVVTPTALAAATAAATKAAAVGGAAAGTFTTAGLSAAAASGAASGGAATVGGAVVGSGYLGSAVAGGASGALVPGYIGAAAGTYTPAVAPGLLAGLTTTQIGLGASVGASLLGTAVQHHGRKQASEQLAKNAEEVVAARRKADKAAETRANVIQWRARERTRAARAQETARGVALAHNVGGGGAGGSTVPAITGNLINQERGQNAFGDRIALLDSAHRRFSAAGDEAAGRPVRAGGTAFAVGSAFANNALSIGKLAGSAFGTSPADRRPLFG